MDLTSDASSKKSSGKSSTALSTPIIRETLLNKSTAEIAKMALSWLEELDGLRAKSGCLQEKISGHIKKKISCLKEVINIFSSRIEEAGDFDYLKRRNSELSSRLRLAMREEERLKEDLKAFERKIKESDRKSRYSKKG